MLGGFTRLALPVVLMLIELTGDATYLLPIMYCAMVGKLLADLLYPPLYPQHMAIEKASPLPYANTQTDRSAASILLTTCAVLPRLLPTDSHPN